MIFVIVAQDDVFHGHVVESTLFLLQPGRISCASTSAVNNDKSFIGNDHVAVCCTRPMDRSKHAFGDLLESGRFAIRSLSI